MNTADLEKIREDSAESFIEVHNQDGVVVCVPLNEDPQARNFKLNTYAAEFPLQEFNTSSTNTEVL